MNLENQNNLTDKFDIPEFLPILPLRDAVVFPYMIFPVLVGRIQSIKAASAAMEKDKLIFLVTQKNSNTEDPTRDDLYTEGTVCKIIQTLKMPNNIIKILVDGIAHGKIVSFTDNPNYIEGQIQIFSDDFESGSEADALIRNLDNAFNEYCKLNKKLPQEVLTVYESLYEATQKFYYVIANLNISLEKRQGILQKYTLKEKFYLGLELLKTEIELLKIENEVEKKIQEKIHKTQKKFFLQEQIRIMQDELGDDEVLDPDLEKLKSKIEEAKLPPKIYDKAIEELNKLKKTPPMSPETTVIRNYIDWLTDIPWHTKTEDNLNLENARRILDEDHYGLEKPKERIIEHIAVLNLVKEMKGQILCFSGPPGVGKTSLAKSIARALGRKFVRISLGGIRDEAEIRGHRRTYIGSMPGKIIQSMKRAGTINPVILLDEIDKMSSDFHGDPTSAMLEVLDPEQNHSFNDHYLDCDYDLSKVLFITTANIRHNIPLPLQDRMEIIELHGYLDFEKISIAQRHIIPKQLVAHGLQDFKISFTDAAIQKIIINYTKEAGVRNLEREITKILRKIAIQIVSQSSDKKIIKSKITINEKDIEDYLGIEKFKGNKVSQKLNYGSAIGLAWTSVGGEILKIDVAIMEGSEKLNLTGQLGDVMKESAMAAYSFIRSHSKELGLDEKFYEKKEIHIHIPEGSIPKDGPSAGITMAVALISAFRKIKVKEKLAMTGEITLHGEILPIGGLNEKLLAAKRNGIDFVIIPEDNQKDLTEINDNIKKGIKIITVGNIFQALPYIFKEFKFVKDYGTK